MNNFVTTNVNLDENNINITGNLDEINNIMNKSGNLLIQKNFNSLRNFKDED